ncbi:hypothetical protein BDY21DRAFT_334081 [Lineolata rhizophorae]|uniref:Uncharacterized protein n=1 Tax=Lineolata rhizophorae TaxID=578093 RepID=A0A6A6PC81_9PEZI|nr:hypothetical protein BDY21DRAFT_334081 [Lineolata rhizophorae]
MMANGGRQVPRQLYGELNKLLRERRALIAQLEESGLPSEEREGTDEVEEFRREVKARKRDFHERIRSEYGPASVRDLRSTEDMARARVRELRAIRGFMEVLVPSMQKLAGQIESAGGALSPARASGAAPRAPSPGDRSRDPARGSHHEEGRRLEHQAQPVRLAGGVRGEGREGVPPGPPRTRSGFWFWF